MNKIKLGNQSVFPFTIPSGIITTEPSTIERYAKLIPELGIITTKTIGPEPKKGNIEPILYQYAPGSFVNAVGLKNPGCDSFAKSLSQIDFPKQKFLLVSVMGAQPEDFCKVVKALEPYADGYELNLSCPHAKGYGQQVGSDPKLVYNIVKAVTAITNKPVLAKLSPNVDDIAFIAKKAMDAGSYGIAAINTVGPDQINLPDGHPILSNKVGGKSGKDVLPKGISSIKQIHEALGDIPILGMGGMRTAKDVLDYKNAGANLFAIGSALAGMRDNEIKEYFKVLVNDINNNTNLAEPLLKEISMTYTKTKLIKKQDLAPDLKILTFDLELKAKPGQFVFVFIPGVSEKPFSILDDCPLTLAVQTRGTCTKAINDLNLNDTVYIRGPHGTGISELSGSELVLVGGGSGIAGLYLFAKHFKNTHKITTILGAKDKHHIFYKEEFNELGKVYITTEDGSQGIKGYVTEVLANSQRPTANSKRDHGSMAPWLHGSVFINCGPKPMIEALLPIQQQLTKKENILSSIDYLTMCGVGICGSCADKRGLRSCVEGPFFDLR